MWLWMLEIFDFHSDNPRGHVVMDAWNIWFPFWQPKRSCGYGCLKYLISILTTQEVMWLWMLEIFDFHSDNPRGHVVMDAWNIWFPFWQPKRSCGYGYLKYLISILTTQEVMWLWMLEIFDFHSDSPNSHVVMDTWNIWFPFWQPKRSCGYGCLKYLISILTTQEVMWLWMLEIFDFHSYGRSGHVVMDTWNIWFPFWQPKRSCGYGYLKYLISILTTQEVMWLWMLEIFDFHSDNPRGHVVMDAWNIWFPFWQPK